MVAPHFIDSDLEIFHKGPGNPLEKVCSPPWREMETFYGNKKAELTEISSFGSSAISCLIIRPAAFRPPLSRD